MTLFRTPRLVPWLYPSLTWRKHTNQKEIFLTFDDGPVEGATEFVLNILERYNAKGTFFCIGDNVRKHPHILRKIVQQGHSLGNHTYHHLKGWRTSREQYLENIKQCTDEISRHSDQKTRLFRPPYGQITRLQIASLRQFEIVMWDVLTWDFSKTMSPERSLRGTIRAIRPGSIVVMHDSYKAERIMQYVLPRVLDHFSNVGYQFKSLAS